MGEYCALVPSLELIAENTKNEKATVLAEALDIAIAKYLENGRLPSRKVNEIDNRGSTFYLGLYWAQALADQDEEVPRQVGDQEAAQRESRQPEEELAPDRAEHDRAQVEFG